VTPSPPATTGLVEMVHAEAALGFSADLQVRVLGGDLPRDLNPGLADALAFRITQLGIDGDAPESARWHQCLALVRADEELLWVIDVDPARPTDPLSVHVVLRFSRAALDASGSAEDRMRRFAALAGQLTRQSFPGSEVAQLTAADTWRLLSPRSDLGGDALFVTGLPGGSGQGAEGSAGAPSGAAARRQASLNDLVEAAAGLEAYRIVFCVGGVASQELEWVAAQVGSLRDAAEAQAHQQVTYGENRSLSTNTGTSGTTGTSRQLNERDNLLQTLLRSAEGLFKGLRADDASGKERWERTPAGMNSSSTKGWNDGSSVSTGDSHSWSVERVDTTFQLLAERLERLARMLDGARGEGAFRAAALIFAPAGERELLADLLAGTLSGEGSADHPIRRYPIVGQPQELLLSNRPILLSLAPAVPVLARARAAQYLLLPTGELPGLRLRRAVFFGRNSGHIGRAARGAAFSLGPIAGEGEILASMDELYRHILVTGTTGSGKTWRVLRILESLSVQRDGPRVIVFETAKRTYREELRGRPGSEPLVYTIGDSGAHPFRLNPFFFEHGTSLKRHVAVLSDALCELLPTESMIGPYMRKAVERCYIEAGWNLETSACAEGAVRYPDVIDFAREVRRLGDGLHYGAEVNANFKGALEGRAAVFLDATFQDIFSHDGNRTIDELFPGDAILEMEQLPASELDLPGFILSILLERLRARQTREVAQRRESATGWLLVVEEAHNVLGREKEGRGPAGEGGGGRTLLRNFVRLLQEGRSLKLAVMVVDQSPALLARSVVKNTNTKVILRLEDGEDVDDVGNTLGLTDEEARDLSMLAVGEAVVKTGGMTKPARSAPWPGPAERVGRPLARIAARSPDYVELRARWTEACDGDGPKPDAAWLERALSVACRSPELVAFGARHLDIERPLPVSPDPRALTTEAELLEYALRLHRRAQELRQADVLAPLVRVLIAACARGKRPRLDVAPGAVGIAARLVAAPGRELAELFSNLSSAPDAHFRDASDRLDAHLAGGAIAACGVLMRAVRSLRSPAAPEPGALELVRDWTTADMTAQEREVLWAAARQAD
jgi:hypothetical protein